MPGANESTNIAVLSHSADTERPMNEFSEQSGLRSRLFESFVTRQGATVLPGRYGGDYNGDQLAYMALPDQKIVLLLGVKVPSKNGDVQLDRYSLGDHMQFSPDWVAVLVFSLALADATKVAASVIADAQRDGRLTTALLILKPEDANPLVVLPINQPSSSKES